MAEFNAFVRTTLSRGPHVKRFRTGFVAETIKHETAIHLGET